MSCARRNSRLGLNLELNRKRRFVPEHRSVGSAGAEIWGEIEKLLLRSHGLQLGWMAPCPRRARQLFPNESALDVPQEPSGTRNVTCSAPRLTLDRARELIDDRRTQSRSR